MERRTFLVGAAAAALSACAKDAVPSETGTPTPLPSPEPGAADLDDALEGRRSIRTFTAEPVDDDLLARLLWAAQGQTAPWGGRTAPSAGGLYPLEVYLATDRSLRRYVPDAHRASEVASGDRRGAIADATGGQEAARDAPALFVITAVVERTSGKYGDRAERYVALEAGHACQNLLLEATALGLGAVPMGAFSDEGVREALGVGDEELPLYVVPVGHPAEGG